VPISKQLALKEEQEVAGSRRIAFRMGHAE
jgi:hypothetical protein